MKVEIWSDVMCPFCYIGKRRFEQALEKFDDKEEVEVEWKSFQLNPNLETDTSANINQYLADIKGCTLDHAKQLNGQVTEMAAGVGLTYNFDTAVVANSFDAHRFAHLAKKHNLGDKAEELLFKSYFTDGKNIADHQTLVELGVEMGLDEQEVTQVLEHDTYTNEVHQDVNEAARLGVRGVPFFVFDRKYAISGAQASEVFEQTLQGAYDEWKKEQPLQIIDGDSCGIDGAC
jgi:predicted DsbA family dithiol-disulfide isomerase